MYLSDINIRMSRNESFQDVETLSVVLDKEDDEIVDDSDEADDVDDEADVEDVDSSGLF